MQNRFSRYVRNSLGLSWNIIVEASFESMLRNNQDTIMVCTVSCFAPVGFSLLILMNRNLRCAIKDKAMAVNEVT